MNTLCYCPVTHRHFNAVVRQFDYFGSITFVWFRCPFCDRFGRTNNDAEYNPRYAQWHRQQIDAKLPNTATIVPASRDVATAPNRAHQSEWNPITSGNRGSVNE